MWGWSRIGITAHNNMEVRACLCKICIIDQKHILLAHGTFQT